MKIADLGESRLVGRDWELGELERFFDLASSGQGVSVFVTGEAGSGKTKLSNEFLQKKRAKDVTILSGWCLSNIAIPYFPFIQAFDLSLPIIRNDLGANSNSGLSALLTTVKQENAIDNIDAITAQSWRDRLFALISQKLSFMSSNKPLILFIEDLHWADSASLSLLHYLTRIVSDERILILATYRSDEVTETLEGSLNPLTDTLRLMNREDLFQEIKLPNLNKANVKEIAASMLKGNIDTDLVEKLTVESQGNPLFVIESIRMLTERQELICDAGEWHLIGDKLGIPLKVRDIILRRLSALKPEQRRILDVASVVGDIFEPELLGEILTQSSLSILEVLNTISHSSSLVCCEGRSFVFDHARSREVLYEEIRLPLRMQYHARIGELLEQKRLKFKSFQLADLAYHFKQADIIEKAIKYSIEAGQEALAKYSNAEAINHFSYALERIADSLGNVNLKETALEGLAEAYFANNQLKDAMKTFEQVSHLNTGADKLHALRRAMDSAFFLGEFKHLLELTSEATTLPRLDPLENARVIMNRGRATLFLGNYKEGAQDLEMALKLFAKECSIPDIALTLCGLMSTGTRKGLARALLAVTLYNEMHDERGLVGACFRAGQSFGYMMLAEKASEMYSRAVEIANRIGNFNKAAEAKASSSWLFEAVGDWNRALSTSLEALQLSKKTDSEWVNAIIYSNLVRQYCALGEAEQSKEFISKLGTLKPEIISDKLFVRLALSRAVLLAATGKWQDTEDYFLVDGRPEKKLAYSLNPSSETTDRRYRALFLEKQNYAQEASKEIKIATKLTKKVHKRFLKAAIKTQVLAPKIIQQNQEFEVSIYLINVSQKPVTLTSIDRLLTQDITIMKMPDFCAQQETKINIGNLQLSGFTAQPLKLTLSARASGKFHLNPRLNYIDKGITHEIKLPTIAITAKPKQAKEKTVEHLVGIPLPTPSTSITQKTGEFFEFRSRDAGLIFNFLLTSFLNDYMKRRIVMEKAGWRSLIQIAKGSKISRYSVYGKGRSGPALSELQRRGLVDTRVFPGERGRGGKILKIKISYEKELIKKQIDQRILKPEN
ncbi:MAG TPA: AAA family ATPase [Candidatus Sulfotelmatobacter sp.]|nr:AAA family ATPase [Candidatus Sulfotelmatobacter sp.]